MKSEIFRSITVVVAAIVMVGGLSGCKKDSSDTVIDPGFTNTSGNNQGSIGSGIEPTTVSGLPEFDETTLFHDASGLEIIFFDYNSYALRPDALEALKRNAEKIRQVPGIIIQIEGHCDERGTQEYNLALGEKRALSTRQHLINLGVSGDRLITISYGEEDPANEGHTEAAWSQNRRSEFNKAM